MRHVACSLQTYWPLLALLLSQGFRERSRRILGPSSQVAGCILRSLVTSTAWHSLAQLGTAKTTLRRFKLTDPESVADSLAWPRGSELTPAADGGPRAESQDTFRVSECLSDNSDNLETGRAPITTTMTLQNPQNLLKGTEHSHAEAQQAFFVEAYPIRSIIRQGVKILLNHCPPTRHPPPQQKRPKSICEAPKSIPEPQSASGRLQVLLSTRWCHGPETAHSESLQHSLNSDFGTFWESRRLHPSNVHYNNVDISLDYLDLLPADLVEF